MSLRIAMRSIVRLSDRRRPGPVKFELTDQTRQAVDDFLKETGKRPGEYCSLGAVGAIGR